MMDMEQLTVFVRNNMPAHYRDICTSLKSLTDELEYTKIGLSNMLISSQNRDDYLKAHEIIDAQEALAKCISEINDFLNEIGADNFDSLVNAEAEKDEFFSQQTEVQNNAVSSKERIDYRLFETDDTVAYSITDTPVTFKRPSAFSLNDRKYQATTWKDMLVRLCGLLYKKDANTICDMVGEKRRHGQRRVRMSFESADLNSPMLIPGSNIWVETRRSAKDIRKSILVLLERYSISPDNMKVYFNKDFTALHAKENASSNED